MNILQEWQFVKFLKSQILELAFQKAIKSLQRCIGKEKEKTKIWLACM